jgi:replicative DNA helicase
MKMRDIKWPVETDTTRTEAEEQLIAAILQLPNHQGDIFSGFKAEYFEDKNLGKTFAAALEIFVRGDQVTLLGLKSYLTERDGQVPAWLIPSTMRCETDVILPAQIPTLKSIILKDHVFGVFKVGAHHATTIDQAEKVCTEVLEISAMLEFDNEPDLREEGERFIEKQRRIKDGEMDWGYSFGSSELDERIMLVPGGLYVIGGIKKGGKTQFAISIIDHNLRQSQPVPSLMFSIEMSAEQVLKRLIARRSEINSRKLHTKHISGGDFERIKAAVSDITKTPLQVNQSPDISTTQIMARTRSWKYRNEIPDGSGIVVVDFLQLINNERRKGETEATGLKNIAYSLARMAKQLKLVVIALAQLRNEAEGQEPHIGFLEGSGGIAQAAEAILLIDLVKRRDKGAQSGDWNDFNVIIAGQRHGESGNKIRMLANLKTGLFRDKYIYGGDYGA